MNKITTVSFLKLNGGACVVLMALAMVVAGSQIAPADTTTFTCQLGNAPGRYEDGPSVIELNKTESTVVIHFSANHLINGAADGVTGGDDGHGGVGAYTIGPLPAQVGADTITFSDPNGPGEGNYTIDLLAGTLVNNDSHLTWTCQTAQKQ